MRTRHGGLLLSSCHPRCRALACSNSCSLCRLWREPSASSDRLLASRCVPSATWQPARLGPAHLIKVYQAQADNSAHRKNQILSLRSLRHCPRRRTCEVGTVCPLLRQAPSCRCATHRPCWLVACGSGAVRLHKTFCIAALKLPSRTWNIAP